MFYVVYVIYSYINTSMSFGDMVILNFLTDQFSQVPLSGSVWAPCWPKDR